MKIRTLLGALALTGTLGLALPAVSEAHDRCYRPYGYSDYGYSPSYSYYSHDPYYYDYGYAPHRYVYRYGYYPHYRHYRSRGYYAPRYHHRSHVHLRFGLGF